MSIGIQHGGVTCPNGAISNDGFICFAPFDGLMGGDVEEVDRIRASLSEADLTLATLEERDQTKARID